MSAATQKSPYPAATNSSAAEIKINIGCGGAWNAAGWFGIDQGSTSGIWQNSGDPQFIDLDVKRGLPFPTNSVDVIFSSHTLEHFTYEEGTALLFEIYRVLKIGAPLCLVVPDLDLYITNYVARNRDFLTSPQIIGGKPRSNLADNFLMNFYSDPKFNNTCHKYAYNFENLSSALLNIGFAEVEKVGFHEFTYWPELQQPEFRTPVPQIEAFSLSIQCRKLAFDPNYRERTDFKEARQFARFRDSEQQLSQQFNAALLLNEGLHARLQQALGEISARELQLDALGVELRARTGEAEALQSQIASQSSQLAALRAELASLQVQLEQSLAATQDVEHRRISDQETHRSSQLEAKLELDKYRTLALEASSDAKQAQNQLQDMLAAKLESDRALLVLRARQTASQHTSGLVHYLREGASKGLTPSQQFDSNWYLAQYPDVAKSGINPLLHYVENGAAEGRHPAPNSHAPARIKPLRVVLSDESGSVQLLVADHATQTAIEKSAQDPLDMPGVDVSLYSPVISIILPTFNTPLKYLRAVIQSVQQQSYPGWELCLIDDGSTDSACVEAVKQLAGSDHRIKIYLDPNNFGISEATQKGLEMATGDYVSFLDHDDVLARNALWEAVKVLRKERIVDVIYTDHASLDDEGVVSGVALKPDWSPEFFLSTNFIIHLVFVRRSLANAVGGFKDTIPVAQDIAFMWKLVDYGANVFHLRKVLYYWRSHSGSVATGTSAKSSIVTRSIQTHNEHLKRIGVNATVAWPEYFRKRRIGAYKLSFSPANERQVTIVIPNLNDEDFELSRLAASLKKTRYQSSMEFHVVSRKPIPDSVHSFPFVSHCVENQEGFDEVVYNLPYETIVFLSPGASIVSSCWLLELVGYLSVSEQVGAVGGKVLDQYLKVRAGGVLLLNKPLPICCGEADESDGHWFRGRLVSNVEAVSAKLMATSKRAYADAGGLPIFRYGDASGIAFGLRLRAAGRRVVYNPWSKIVDTADENLPSDLNKAFTQDFGADAIQDTYYHPFFSREIPYAI